MEGKYHNDINLILPQKPQWQMRVSSRSTPFYDGLYIWLGHRNLLKAYKHKDGRNHGAGTNTVSRVCVLQMKCELLGQQRKVIISSSLLFWSFWSCWIINTKTTSFTTPLQCSLNTGPTNA